VLMGVKTEPNVMIGCPVGPGRSYVLPLYLKHIYDLDYPKKKIHIAILFNHPKRDAQVAVPHSTLNQPTVNNEDEVGKIRNILRTFKRKTKSEYRKITIHEYTGNYEDRTIQGRRALGRWMEYFASIRNHWIRMRKPVDEYVFSVDSDILVPKDSLKRLISHRLDIVSLLLANGPVTDPYISTNRLDNFLLPYNITYGGVHPHFISRANMTGKMAFNVMMEYDSPVRNPRNKYDSTNYRHVDPAELHVRETLNYDSEVYYDNLENHPNLGPWTVPQRYGELAEVDMTGAAYLIHRKVLDSGVMYGFHHQGEDCYFCNMAKEHGFKLHCDYTVRADHIMSEEVYRNYVQTKQLRVLGFPNKGKPKLVNGLESNVEVVLEKVKSY